MEKILEKFKTPFGEYTIVEKIYNDRPVRMLLSSSGAPQSGVGLDDNPEQLFTYNQRFMEIAVGLGPERSLVIGGGTFTFPVALARYFGNQVDVVEVNPVLPDIARKHFEFIEPDEGMDVYIEDGFEYIKKCTAAYDYIVVDAFVDRVVPESLTSESAAAEYKRIVTEGGAIAFNCISRYHTWSETTLKTLVRSLETQFEYVDVYPATEGYDKRSDQNLIVIASDVDNSIRHEYLQSHSVEVLGL